MNEDEDFDDEFEEMFEMWFFFLEKATWATSQLGVTREGWEAANEWFELGDKALRGARFVEEEE